jgi:hypothetical protein
MGISNEQFSLWCRFKWVVPLLICAVALFAPAPADASGFRVLNADTKLVDGVYRLNAIIDYDLTTPVRQALLNGVELVFEVKIAVLRDRMWWWDRDIADLDQSYRLSYHALSRQFLVENLNTGLQRTFPDLRSALRHQGIVRELPLIDASLLDHGYTYIASLRAQLALNELPLPIRVRAYLSADWRLGSGWYTWELS